MGREQHLEVLSSCSNEELDPLVAYILAAKTNSLSRSERYKNRKGHHREYVPEIVDEIRRFGGSTILNLFRGDGVPYSEIVRDVAEKIGAKLGESQTDVEGIELEILAKILEKSASKMTDEERRSLEDDLESAGLPNIKLSSGIPIGALLLQAGAKGSGFVAYRVAAIVANGIAKLVLGKGLSFAANAALMRSIAVATGPIGWAITGLWTVIDLSGPAFRVTIPVVCHIAYLRQKKRFEALGGL